jgi:hypothetical protein
MRPAKNPETNRRLNMYEHPKSDFLASDWLKNKKSYPFQALPVLENVPGSSLIFGIKSSTNYLKNIKR